MQSELHASALSGAWTLALYGAFMAAGRFASGGLLAFTNPLTLMLASALGGTAAMVGLTYVHSLWAGWLLFGLSGLFVACFWPTLLSVAGHHIAAASTSLFALLAAAGIVGCVVVPWAIGAMGDAFGLRPAMLLLPAAMGLLVILLVSMARLIHRRVPV
jgi:fucose permease